MSDTPTARLLARYRDAAERTGDPDPAVADTGAHDAHELYKQLRDTAEGRVGISALMLDPHPRVRRWAATHALSWKREMARAVLAELRKA